MSRLFLTLDEVLSLHDEQIRLFGGSRGLRDAGLLQSAMENTEATFNRRFLHETVTETAAAYLYGICRNHPFFDGNKRTAVAAALVFLAINDVEIDADDDEFHDLVIGVSVGRVTKAEVAVFLQKNVRET